MKSAAGADIAARLAKLAAEVGALRNLLTQDRQSASTQLRNRKLLALAELAAGAGHEINNPLAVISGQAQYLLRTEESLERARCLERIIFQSQRIHEILRDLMFYARPPRLKRSRVNLYQVVGAAVESMTDFALERRVTLEQPGIPGRVQTLGDRKLLEAAVTALLRNAIQAAPAGGWVRIRLKLNPPARVAIIVEDNGIGLTASQCEHLFDPFYSSRPAGRGLGMGLPKVWRIAQLHGGDIQFDSKPGRPTRFLLSLPVAAARRSTKKSSRSFSKNGHAGNGKLARRVRAVRFASR